MSKITNPSGEPSVNCGFFDSFGGDRKYYTSDISHLFDGIIRDGIFASIGDQLKVTANGENNTITVGTGKCWFNRTFTEVISDTLMNCPDSDPVLHRYDAVVIEIDKSIGVRDCSIEIISGPGSTLTPERPVLKRDDVEQKYQYALCYIYRESKSTVIKPSDITDVRGRDETPFVTGILDVLEAETLLTQWDAQLNEFVAKEKVYLDKFISAIETDANKWSTTQKAAFKSWFDTIKGLLSEDAAGNLLALIDKDEIERLLVGGLANGSKMFSDDGSVITSVDEANGYQLVKTFSSDFTSCTTVLTKGDIELGRLVKTFNSDGSISSELTII